MNMNSPAKIGAVIPTFNRKDSLQKCLDCLLQQEIDKEKIVLIPIVVVDGSTDGTTEMILQHFPSSEIVHGNGNWWYTRSINEGIKRAQQMNCDFVLTLNDDLLFNPDYVRTILNDYFISGENSIVGSVSLTQTQPRHITFSGISHVDVLLKEQNYLPKFSKVEESDLTGIKKSIVLSGRGILYPIHIFEELGLYDEKFVQYSSETDFTYRATQLKKNVVISYNAIVYENVQLTSSGAVYNNPTLRSLIRSFSNIHSINSFRKIYYYSIKHRGHVKGSVIALIRIGGIIKKFVAIKLKSGK